MEIAGLLLFLAIAGGIYYYAKNRKVEGGTGRNDPERPRDEK